LLVSRKAVKQLVIEGADHGRCGAARGPQVIAMVEQ